MKKRIGSHTITTLIQVFSLTVFTPFFLGCTNHEEPLPPEEVSEIEIRVCDELGNCNISYHNNLPGEDYSLENDFVILYGGNNKKILNWELVTNDLLLEVDIYHSAGAQMAVINQESRTINFSVCEKLTGNLVTDWRFEGVWERRSTFEDSGDIFFQWYLFYHSYQNLPEWVKITKKTGGFLIEIEDNITNYSRMLEICVRGENKEDGELGMLRIIQLPTEHIEDRWYKPSWLINKAPERR